MNLAHRTIEPFATGTRPARRTLALLCAAELLGMAGYATYPALLPELERVWRLDGLSAGAISGAYLAGYVLCVLVLSGLTDRFDARRIYVSSALLAAAATFAFASADGPRAATLAQALAGAGLAGTYMPGLRILTDRVRGPHQSRYVALYTASFGVGASLSLALAGTVAHLFDWRAAFLAAAVGPLLSAALVGATLRGAGRRSATPPRALSNFRAVFANREALGYVTGYAAHCWELFGLRAWTVAFLAYNLRTSGASSAPEATAAACAAAINLLGAPASILGNEVASRAGRHATIATCMVVSAGCAVTIGFCANGPSAFVVVLLTAYNVFVMGDSAALTAGLVASTDESHRGAAMAVHSFLGFGGGVLAPVVFGFALDRAGGTAGPLGWGLAFSTLAGGYAIRLAWVRVRTPPRTSDGAG